MHQLVVPVGYMGSGSSAVTDLVGEVEGFQARGESFEYVFLHCPNGVFDLEDKLLVGNNALRSDEALHSFAATMRQLYDKKWWWVGDYRRRVGAGFWPATEAYLSELIAYQPEFYWYMQENTDRRMFFQLLWRRVVSLASFGRVQLKKPLLYSPIWLSFPEPEAFYAASRRYLARVFDLMGLGERALILDQLLLPHNLHRIDSYFGDNLRAIVVSRDPRDVFILNKYVWPAQHQQVPYPTEAEAFCRFYRQLRGCERPYTGDRALRIAFEDLIYAYDDAVRTILSFLGADPAAHHPRTRFDPARSIENTQLFRQPAYQREAEIIAQQLPEYLYPYPFVRAPRTGKSF